MILFSQKNYSNIVLDGVNEQNMNKMYYFCDTKLNQNNPFRAWTNRRNT